MSILHIKSSFMTIRITLNTYLIIFSLIACGTFSGHTQETSEITDKYKTYTKAAREIAYLHLNKSTFIKGEDVGFTAYILDKKSKNPSLITTNLYVSIEDDKQNIIKQKLIKVVDGVASNTFELDSLFTSGYYKIKAYTNWMLNFNEKNYFTESIRVIDYDNEDSSNKPMIADKIDAQFLPESGHLLNGVLNVIGVVIKDNFGYGIPFAKGEVLDKNNTLITTFETNQFGIGKFQLIPDLNNEYKVNIISTKETFSFNINQKIESTGIIISLKSLQSKVFISLLTNQKTLEILKNKRHTLMIHNGDYFDIMDVYFTDSTEITKAIDYSNTASGMNILTLFNEDDLPIAERLFFNHEGIEILKSDHVSATRSNDSLNLNLNFKDIDTNAFNSLSISVLPQDTRSYKRHQNLVSYSFLEPYVNGTVEQAKYYFTDVDAKKKYELDNLLITQGWSSYDWNDIFSEPLDKKHKFEQGITVKANLIPKELNKNSETNYLMHAIGTEAPRTFSVQPNDKSFLIESIFPEGTNTLFLSKASASKGLLPAKLYLQFFPNSIPPLDDTYGLLAPKMDYRISETINSYNSKTILNKSVKIQKLDEVTIKSIAAKNRQRKEKFSKGRFGRVYLINEEDERTFSSLAHFLSFKGLLVEESTSKSAPNNPFIEESISGSTSPEDLNIMREIQGGFTVSSNNGSLAIYLDDMRLIDTSFLMRYDLSYIDAIEINKFGVGEGLRGATGTLRIYSNKDLPKVINRKSIQDYKIPLTFSEQKKIYIPKYSSYKDDFFKDYGIISWEPELKTDHNGNVSFKIASPKVPITLYIEGVTLDGSFIFEEKVLQLN
ncbi:TonB-dependent receptor [Winogradskyella epiphytica]|nr:TonB-dependent receptor [Winogradskyella epiphytica]